MGGLFAAGIVPMRGIGVIESFPVNILSVGRKMVPHGVWQIFVAAIGHGSFPFSHYGNPEFEYNRARAL